MTLEDFFLLDEDSLFGCLEDYQQSIIKELVLASNGDYLEAANKWLGANMQQTVVFGGEGKKSSIYRDKVFGELEKFVCGCDDGTYDEEREQLRKNGATGKEYIISILSAAIGAKIGVAAAFVAPIIVLIIQSLGKIVINAWCESLIAKRGDAHD